MGSNLLKYFIILALHGFLSSLSLKLATKFRVRTSRLYEGRDVDSNRKPTKEVLRSWRIYNIDVLLENDPGKDDLSVHPSLLESLSKELKLSKADGDALKKVLTEKGSENGEYKINIVRKSFDGRWKKAGQPRFTYTLDVTFPSLEVVKRLRLKEINGKANLLPSNNIGAELLEAQSVKLVSPAESKDQACKQSTCGKCERVIVVGAGPAGLFAAIELIKGGYVPLIIERGQPVEQRGRDIGALFNRKILNPDSNLCYGEGGAGTWSDGKLTTRIGKNSDDVREVLKLLVHHGAPESILAAGKPHLGTDRLVKILRTLRANLVGAGAEFLFGHTVFDILVHNGSIQGVKVRGSAPALTRPQAGAPHGEHGHVRELKASKVVFAIGHSARGLYEKLLSHEVRIESKPIAVGFRVEHPQDLINSIQYGPFGDLCQRGKGRVPVADYRLTAQVSEEANDTNGGKDRGDSINGIKKVSTRGVYSFCMCPGGQIVPTSVNPEELCINGMSFSQRQSRWANSALVVTVRPEDMVSESGKWSSDNPLRGVLWQEEFERKAATMGGGNLVAPVQRATDFLSGKVSLPDEGTGLFSSSYRMGVKAAPLHELYPSFITSAVQAALKQFDHRMPGFLSPEAILHGVETRTSAPVQIMRDRRTYECVSMAGLYPAGEGAGYAGGIVSAAVDGLRVGRAVCGHVSKQDIHEAFDVY